MCVQYWWNDSGRGETKCSEKTWRLRNFVHHKSQMDCNVIISHILWYRNILLFTVISQVVKNVKPLQWNLRGCIKQTAHFPSKSVISVSNTQGKGKGKGLPQQTEVAQAVPGMLRPRIFLAFGTTRVVGRQPYATAAFTPGEIPGTHF